MAKPGAKPRGQVDTTWTPNVAYALGLLASDGNLSKDGRRIDLTSKDREQIVTFKQCLRLDHVKIGRKQRERSKKKEYFRVQFGDVLFYQWLLRLGFTPNKSKTLGKLKIPRRYFFDFLRGCMDGDGSMYAYWDPRWHSSYMFYMDFSSASLPFLLWLQEEIARHLLIHGKINYSTKGRAYRLRFAKQGTTALCKRMYYAKDAPHLERKFTKAQEIFRINELHNNARVAKQVNAPS